MCDIGDGVKTINKFEVRPLKLFFRSCTVSRERPRIDRFEIGPRESAKPCRGELGAIKNVLRFWFVVACSQQQGDTQARSERRKGEAVWG